MKKFLSFFILIMIACVVFASCSVNTPKHKTSVTSSDVALLTLFTFDGKKESKFGLFNLGHSFLSVENISSETITIGKVEVAPNETISIGTWSSKAHFGVWYNVESNYIKDYNKYDGRISITAGISSQDTEKMNKFILAHDYWSPTNNCSNFALNLWNTVAEEDEELVRPFIYSPSKIAKALKNFEGYETNREIKTSDKFFYMDENTPKYFELEV